MFLENKEEKKMCNIATIMKKLCLSVNGVIDLGIKINKKYDEQNSEYFGYFIDMQKYGIDEKSDTYIWFGISYEVWEKYADAALIVEVSSDDEKILNAIKQLDGIKEFQYKESIAYFYPFAMEENSDIKAHYFQFIEEKVKDLKKIINANNA